MRLLRKDVASNSQELIEGVELPDVLVEPRRYDRGGLVARRAHRRAAVAVPGSDGIRDQVVRHYDQRHDVGWSRAPLARHPLANAAAAAAAAAALARPQDAGGEDEEASCGEDHGVLPVLFVDDHGLARDALARHAKDDGRERQERVHRHCCRCCTQFVSPVKYDMMSANGVR